MGQLRVVVEHLLEVRHQPVRVGAVAREAAAQLVVDAAVGHPVEGRGHHAQRRRVPGAVPGAEQELERHRRAGTSARRRSRRAPRRSEARQPSRGLLRARARSDRPPPGGNRQLLAQVRRQLSTLRLDLVAPVPVRLGDRRQHAREGGQAVAILGRKVGAAEERLAASGVRKTLIGQPPPPVMAWTAAM